MTKQIIKDRKTNLIAEYEPYGLLPTDTSDWQMRFHADGKDNPQRLLMCANRVGKTLCGKAEVAYHATGQYPKWWVGKRFNHPVLIWACGSSAPKVRNTLQDGLIGKPSDPDSFGTGFISLKYLDRKRATKKMNVPNAFDSIEVRHASGGWSTLVFKAYEQGQEAFKSESVDVILLDEEPKQTIMTQCMTRQVDNDGILFMTFTPEQGMTEIVTQFLHDLCAGQSLVTAGWDDITHLSTAKKEQILNAYPVYERDMRTKGIPVFGSGLVYPVSDESILWSQTEIPNHWRRLCAIDFGGWNWHTAAVWIAWDTEADVMYLYDVYKAKGLSLADHASAIRAKGKDILCIYPHDANKAAGRDSGESLADMYRNEGVNMNDTHFLNPVTEGTGKGNLAIAPGLVHIYQRMTQGRFKVAKHLEDWWKEKRLYHTVDGKIVESNDDLMDATRMCVQSMDMYSEIVRQFRPRRQDTYMEEYNVYN